MTGRRGSRRNQPTQNYRESSPSDLKYSREPTEGTDPPQPSTREPEPEQHQEPAREMDQPPLDEGINSLL